jgi:hypothetical protein
MVFDFDKIIQPIRAGKQFVRDTTSQLQGLLNTTSFASEAAINAAITAFGDSVQANLPDPSQLAEIAHLVDNCAYLKENFDTAGLIAATANSAIGKIDTLMDQIAVGLPEFNMGKLASSINDLLFGNIPGSSIISDSFKAADKLINCLSAYCGGEYPAQILSYVDTMNELYEDLNIIDDPVAPNYGKYDMERLFTEQGISIPNQAKVTNVIGAADSAKSTAMTKITDTIGGLKAVGNIF